MSISFSHVFDDFYRSSPIYEDRNLLWFLELEGSEETYRIRLFGGPEFCVYRQGVHWNITVDVVCRVGKLEVSRLKKLHLCNLDEQLIGETLFEAKKTTLLENESVKTYQAIPVTVEISNIQTKGIRYFAMNEFKSPSADITLSVRDEIFHCHSQVLEQCSNVFKEMVEGMYKPTKLDLFIVAFFPSIKFEKTPFNIPLKEDYSPSEFRDFLHHVYYPTEAVDEQNLKFLLEMGKKFEVAQLLHTCQQTMKVQIDHSEWTSWTVQLGIVAWLFNLQPLKIHFLQQLFQSSMFKEVFEIKTILSCESYQQMNEEDKLEMIEMMLYELTNKQSEEAPSYESEEGFGLYSD